MTNRKREEQEMRTNSHTDRKRQKQTAETAVQEIKGRRVEQNTRNHQEQEIHEQFTFHLLDART